MFKKPYDQPADEKSIEKALAALRRNNIDAILVETGQEAKKKVLSLIPPGAEVMNMSSITLETLGLDKEINDSGRYDSVKNKLNKMKRETDNLMMQKMGAAPEWSLGSVQAITEEGQLVFASNSGSQIPAHSYASVHVILIAGAQKIVKNLEEGLKRIYEYCLPLEDKHMKDIGGTGSAVNKILVINKDKKIGRITLILVKEKMGF